VKRKSGLKKEVNNIGNVLDRKVLVLNQTYEPLTVCHAKRAITLLFLGKAEMIEKANGIMVRSVSMALPLPLVLRLNYYVKVERKEIPLTKTNVMKRDNYTCQYCGKQKTRMTIDHVIPKEKGGKDVWENLVCACEECNTKKGNRTPAQAGMRLLKKPKKPHYFTFVLRSISNPPPQWKPYLFLS